MQALLDAHVSSGDFLASSALETYPELGLPFGGQIEEFQIVRLVGKGGMGKVYLAKDTKLNRMVALKTVGHLDEGTHDKNVAERFRREAQAAARLVHPSVVQVYRTGEKDGISYIAMEYVDGQTLQQWLTEQAEDSHLHGEKYHHKVSSLLAEIADAMEQAHQAGVVHRDVKPSNILIDQDGKARLADFGIARILNEDTLEDKDAIAGSYAYMSPEQAHITSVEVDHRSDIFSLGVVLYEAISFQRPFTGSSYPDLLNSLSECNPKKLSRLEPRVSNDLAVVCHKALEKQLDDRYQSAAHFAADLRCVIQKRPILARPPGYLRRARYFVQRHQRKTM
ncbi:MAG: serine/threonine-protein kinase [Planctomycetota bacterium]